MKKKGLIIATIVMVLVLAVSLTTATYAWFTVANETTIDPISLAVTSNADVLIGLKTDNTYKPNAVPADFMYGETAVGAGFTGDTAAMPTQGTPYWTGGTSTLGNEITLALDLDNMKKAVGTGKVETEAGALALSSLRTVATTSAAGPVQASGEEDVADAATVERAIAQEDYVDVVIGVKANQSNLTSIVCNVVINPTAGEDLGINAAIHVAWKINGDITAGADGNREVYTSNSYGTVRSELGYSLVNSATNMGAFGGKESATLNPGAAVVAIPVATAAEGTLSRETIYQIHLVIWIDGQDDDAISSALNVASEIYVSFSATKAA